MCFIRSSKYFNIKKKKTYHLKRKLTLINSKLWKYKIKLEWAIPMKLNITS